MGEVWAHKNFARRNFWRRYYRQQNFTRRNYLEPWVGSGFYPYTLNPFSPEFTIRMYYIKHAAVYMCRWLNLPWRDILFVYILDFDNSVLQFTNGLQIGKCYTKLLILNSIANMKKNPLKVNMLLDYVSLDVFNMTVLQYRVCYKLYKKQHYSVYQSWVSYITHFKLMSYNSSLVFYL